MQPLSGNQRPDLLTALMNMPHASCTAPATENASLQTLFKCPTPAIVLEMLQNPHVLLTFDKVHNPLRLPRETSSEPPKVVRTWCVLYMLTSKCASRHNGVHFFDISTSKSGPTLVCTLYIVTSKCASRHNGVHFSDISTSKSGPELVCFVHFDLEMCFAPQRHALSRHLNFEKCSEREVLWAFHLQMCFAPQRRAIFHLSSGQLAPHPPL